MKLQRREKILAGATGGLLVVLVLWLLAVTGDSRSVTRLSEDRKTARADIEKKEKLLDAARRDAKRLAEWRRRSLPATAEPGDAPTGYYNWLVTLANHARIGAFRLDYKEVGARRVESRDPAAKHEVPRQFSYTLHGRASLAGLAQFLYEFYSAGHLHLIRHAELKPQENSREIDVTLTIEALAMPDADRKDELSKEAGEKMRFAKLDEYREPIAARDLFTAYTPTDKSAVDPAEYTFVTGITEVDGRRQVWLFDRMAGKKWILGEGGEFRVGDGHGTVKSIASTREVIIEFDGRSRRLCHGQNLRGGEPVESEKTEKSDKAGAERGQTTPQAAGHAEKTDAPLETTAKLEHAK